MYSQPYLRSRGIDKRRDKPEPLVNRTNVNGTDQKEEGERDIIW